MVHIDDVDFKIVNLEYLLVMGKNMLFFFFVFVFFVNAILKKNANYLILVFAIIE